MTRSPCRLGSTYRISVSWYAFSDGTTLTDLDAAPTLQAYQSDGTTAVGAAITCTKASTGVYYGDLPLTTANGFTTGQYIWKMAGASAASAVNQTGELLISHTV
jgi:hypothetical protein